MHFPKKYLYPSSLHLASLVAQMVKNLLEMQETQVQSLGQEDDLKKEMVTHSSILGQRSLEGYSPWGCRVGHK